jgi:hypothetical protein
MKYLICFLHLCLQLNSIYMSPYITRNMHPSVSEADKDKLVKITDPKYLYACVSEEVCRLIKEYDISADNRFSCYELAIKIELPTLKSLSATPTIIPTAYLTMERSILSKAPEESKKCLRIKRYINHSACNVHVPFHFHYHYHPVPIFSYRAPTIPSPFWA